ncbi:MAG: hypothetical protein VKK07_06310 [Merismopediaceae bacterium]|nr:hypothetical protein [Merismopediaceae bacterium]
MPKPLLLPKLGEILQSADLITTAQIEVALQNQQYYQLRLGEILALHGWLEQETVDFFAETWPQLLMEGQAQPLGYYLKQAKLLSLDQIQIILKEQKHLGIRFGAVAVLKGWLKEKTLDFFLENLSPQTKGESDFQGKDGGEDHFIEDQETGFIKKRSEILHIGESSITLPDESLLQGSRSTSSPQSAKSTRHPTKPLIQVPRSKSVHSLNFPPLPKLEDGGENFDLASVLELDMEDFGLTASTEGSITW